MIEHGIPDFIGDRGPEAVCTVSYQAAVTPERLSALEAVAVAAGNLLARFPPGAFINAIALSGLRAAWQRVDATARPDAPATEPTGQVTPERLAALEAEHAALLSHIQRGADATPTLRDYIDWVKAVYQPGPQNKWMALLEAAERVEQLARPAAGEVRSE